MSRLLFFCSRVLSCVVTYSFDLQFRLANGFLARAGENKARVRGALTKREGKTKFRAVECIEHMHTAVDRKSKKTYEIYHR